MHPYPPVKFGIILFVLSICFVQTVMAETKLDLSLPKDMLQNTDLFPTKDSINNSEDKQVFQSAEQAFYVENANEKILRRLKAVPAQDQFGKQICGKVEYRAAVRPDGQLEVVEVVPVKVTDDYKSKVDFYLDQTPRFGDATEVSRLKVFTADDDEITIFVKYMTQAIHSAAPFPLHPKNMVDMSKINSLQKNPQLTFIYGTFWRECHGWTPPKKVNKQ